jgi:hypothetical protein
MRRTLALEDNYIKPEEHQLVGNGRKSNIELQRKTQIKIG